MKHTFLDLSAKAKELGVSEAVLKAQCLSGDHIAFIYITSERATGTQTEFLPPWEDHAFPFVHWDDFGSHLSPASGRGKELGKSPDPEYVVTGWVALPMYLSGRLLAKKEDCNLHDEWVWIIDSSFSEVCPVRIRVNSVWIREDDSGFYQSRLNISPSDIYFVSEHSAAKDGSTDARPEPKLRSDARETYAKIIGALWMKAHDSGGPGKLSQDPYTAAKSLEQALSAKGVPSPSADTIGRILAKEVPAAGVKIGSSDSAD